MKRSVLEKTHSSDHKRKKISSSVDVGRLKPPIGNTSSLASKRKHRQISGLKFGPDSFKSSKFSQSFNSNSVNQQMSSEFVLDIWDFFPIPAIKNIFSFLEPNDLIFSCQNVCSKWNWLSIPIPAPDASSSKRKKCLSYEPMDLVEEDLNFWRESQKFAQSEIEIPCKQKYLEQNNTIFKQIVALESENQINALNRSKNIFENSTYASKCKLRQICLSKLHKAMKRFVESELLNEDQENEDFGINSSSNNPAVEIFNSAMSFNLREKQKKENLTNFDLKNEIKELIPLSSANLMPKNVKFKDFRNNILNWNEKSEFEKDSFKKDCLQFVENIGKSKEIKIIEKLLFSGQTSLMDLEDEDEKQTGFDENMMIDENEDSSSKNETKNEENDKKTQENEENKMEVEKTDEKPQKKLQIREKKRKYDPENDETENEIDQKDPNFKFFANLKKVVFSFEFLSLSLEVVIRKNKKTKIRVIDSDFFSEKEKICTNSEIFDSKPESTLSFVDEYKFLK